MGAPFWGLVGSAVVLETRGAKSPGHPQNSPAAAAGGEAAAGSGDGAHLLGSPAKQRSASASDEALMLLQRQNEALLKRVRTAEGLAEENKQLKAQLARAVRPLCGPTGRALRC